MQTQFSILKKSRELLLLSINNLSVEQLHSIPKGFKNHIAWNFAHTLVTQQLLHYKLSGNPCIISSHYIQHFGKGSFPDYTLSKEELQELKDLTISLPNQLEKDYQAGLLAQYHPYKTSTGYVLEDIDTAISFNNYHEGAHLGIIMSQKKVI